jgi:3-keto-5-aminohexanoate cleavage enzyme
MSARDAYQPNGSVNPSRLVELFADVATELMIRLDGDEGVLRGLQQLEALSPVFVGDFIEVTGVVTKIGNTTRQIAFEARKVATCVRSSELPLSAADALAAPPLVCRAIGTASVARPLQRRPRLVLPALPAAARDAARLPQGNVVITPPPHVVITPPRETPPEVMIVASIVGGGVTRDHTPHVPVSSEEIAREAKRCRDAGASVVFLGVGAPSDSSSALADRMRDAVEAIRAETDVVIVVSSVAAGPADVERRVALSSCGADIVTMATGTFNFGEAVVTTPRALARDVAAVLRDEGVHTIVEALEVGHFEEALAFGREKLIPAPHRFQFVLGVPGALGAHEETIHFVASRIPRNAIWFAAGVGRHQRRVTETVMRLGGHVRLGLADNIYMRKGVLAEGSAPFIERAAGFARGVNRQPADPDRARELLGLVIKVDAPQATSETIPDVRESEPPIELEAQLAAESDGEHASDSQAVAPSLLTDAHDDSEQDSSRDREPGSDNGSPTA